MVRRNVERREVVEVLFDVGTFRDLEAHLAENLDDLVDGLADWMQASLRARAHRQRHIELLALKARIDFGLSKLGFARLDRRGDRILQLIELGARTLALIGRKRAQP